MKKTETKSNLQKPKNILYRVVMAIMAFCVPIVAYFNELIYIVWDSKAFQIISQLQGNKNDNGQTEQGLSVRMFIEEILPQMKGAEDAVASSAWETLAPIHTELICVLLFLCLTVLIAVAVFFVACFCRNWIAGTSVAGAGLVSVIGFAISFHYLAAALLAGKVSLASFMPNAILGLLAGGIMKLSIFQLSTAFYLMLFLFIAMVVWGVSNGLLTMGEKQSKVNTKA